MEPGTPRVASAGRSATASRTVSSWKPNRAAITARDRSSRKANRYVLRPPMCGPCRASPTHSSLHRSASNRPNTAGAAAPSRPSSPARPGEPPRFRIPNPIRSGRNGGRSMRERRRKFTPEFKDDAVKMVIESSRPIAEVAREIQVNEGTLGSWVHKYRLDHVGEEPPLSISDRARLRELERENRELKMKAEFLGKAAAFFAQEYR